MKIPRLLTKEEWTKTNYENWEKHHNIEEVFETWVKALDTTKDRWEKDRDNRYYNVYKDWYYRQYSKLGRVLS